MGQLFPGVCAGHWPGQSPAHPISFSRLRGQAIPWFTETRPSLLALRVPCLEESIRHECNATSPRTSFLGSALRWGSPGESTAPLLKVPRQEGRWMIYSHSRCQQYLFKGEEGGTQFPGAKWLWEQTSLDRAGAGPFPDRSLPWRQAAVPSAFTACLPVSWATLMSLMFTARNEKSFLPIL